MNRTQLSLEGWQYLALKTQAERQGKSISAVVRGILSAHFGEPEGPAAEDPFASIMGMAADETSVAEEHDRVLYGVFPAPHSLASQVNDGRAEYGRASVKDPKKPKAKTQKGKKKSSKTQVKKGARK